MILSGFVFLCFECILTQSLSEDAKFFFNLAKSLKRKDYFQYELPPALAGGSLKFTINGFSLTYIVWLKPFAVLLHFSIQLKLDAIPIFATLRDSKFLAKPFANLAEKSLCPCG
ncbi:hypothetical protein C4F50_06480 [Flavobacterium sp. KB82]|uniref:Uncharacterized protein n=1 Tax=Flavobacterium hungaricum TaxID=2082725 RepID=A0ABR9TGU8_9FLAO|nr:hypothetical protein [Flavobacterium hungaricum]